MKKSLDNMSLSLFNFSRKITDLTKAKEFKNALDFFINNYSSFTEEQIRSNDYIISGIINSVRNVKRYTLAFLFLEKFQIEISKKTSERILNAYGWMLYFKFKEDHTDDNTNYNEEKTCFNDDNEENIQNYTFNKSECIKDN